MLVNPSNAFIQFIEFNENHQLNAQLKPAYFQLGFICSVQALPDLIDLEQWLNYLWKEEGEVSFDDQQQATEYAQQVLKMVSVIQHLYQNALPLNDLLCTDWITDNVILSSQGIEFAAGFLMAVELFNEQWLLLGDDNDAQNILQTSILLLTKLSPPDDISPALLALLPQLPEVPEILRILPQLLSNLAYSAAQTMTSDESL